MLEIAYEMLKVLDLRKTRLTDVLDMPQEGKIPVKPYTKVPDHLSRQEEITKNIYWERFVEFFMLHL